MQEFDLNVATISGFDLKYYYDADGEIRQAREFPPHVGDTVEVYLLVDGDVSFMVEHHLYKLSPGDMILTKPNEMHNCILNSASPHRHFCFWFSPDSEYLFGDLLAHEFGSGNLISPPTEDKEIILGLCTRLYEASLRGEQTMAFALALEFLAHVKRNLNASAHREILPEALRTILRDIEDNFATIGTLEEFAAKYYMSRSTMNRLFRRYLQTSPKRYLETKRLAYSRILLKEGKSVSEACGRAGFPDYTNYIRLFRQRFGITPLQYRNS